MSPVVHLILGEDEYLVSERGRELAYRLVPPEDRAFGLEVIDGRSDTSEAACEAVSLCLAALMTPGFMASRKVIWFKDVSCFGDQAVAKTAGVKAQVERLTTAIKQGLLPGQILVVTSPKVDKRCAFFKACKEAGSIEEFAVADKQYLAERQAKEQLTQVLRKAKLQMGSDVADAFLRRVGLNTRQIVGEVEKLAVFLGDRRQVEVGDVAAVTSSSRGALAWDLADAFGARQLGKALSVVRQLLFQRESTIGILVGLQSRIKELMVYREALDHGWLAAGQGRGSEGGGRWLPVPPEVDVIMAERLGKDPRAAHPYRIGLLAEQAKGFSRAALDRCLTMTVQAHTQLVTGSMPDDIVLEMLLIRMLPSRVKR